MIAINNAYSDPTPTPYISRGASGDCCVLCGRVGIDLPDEHGCQPTIDVEAYRAQPRHNWNELWTRTNVRGLKPPSQSPQGWIDTQTGEVLPHPPEKLMKAQLAGWARMLAYIPEGQRNTALHWVWRRLIENSHPPQSYEVIAAVARAVGLPNSEVQTTLRCGRGVAA